MTHSLPAPLGGVLQRYRGRAPAPPKRKPGRPRKRTPEYLMALLATHREIEAWFAQEHGCRHNSERQLYTSYFAREFTNAGERASRAQSADFQRALKTLRNELSEARRLLRSKPDNA